MQAGQDWSFPVAVLPGFLDALGPSEEDPVVQVLCLIHTANCCAQARNCLACKQLTMALQVVAAHAD